MASSETEALVEALRAAVLGVLEKKLDDHKADILAALEARAFTRGNLQLEESIFNFEGPDGQASTNLLGRGSSWLEISRSADSKKLHRNKPSSRDNTQIDEHQLAIVPRPDDNDNVQLPVDELPGLMPSKDTVMPQRRSSETHPGAAPAPTFHSAEVYQETRILGMDVTENCTGTGCSASVFREAGACGILLHWGKTFKAVMIALFLSEVVLAILVHQYGHVHGVVWDFTAVSLTVYFMVGFPAVALLEWALRSEALNLVALKLELHYSDEQRTKLLNHEKTKYAAAWLAFMALVLVGQGLEVWNIQRGVLDSTILVLEDLHTAKVYAQINEAVTVLSFAFVSAIILLTCYVQSVLLLAVDGALDRWCMEVSDCQDYELGVKTWNRMQALLKCLGRELENSTILLQAFGGIGFVAYVASAAGVALQVSFESLSLSMLGVGGVPAIFLFLIAIRLGGQAASLTEKCRALPAFVNQIPGACIDLQRQYLVRFIADTSAGFIVKGVTLTQGMFLKQLYLLGTLLTGVLGMFIRIYL